MNGTPPPPPNLQPVIWADHAQLVFGERAGVFDLSFQIAPGTIFGLIGPSGSGKTTTVRLLTGLYRPASGAVRVLGEDPVRFRTITRESIGFMPQHFVLYPQLTVTENLNFVASLYGLGPLTRRKPLAQLLDFVELTEAHNRLGSQLSGGMQRRLALAAALVNRPVLIFADEPTAGVDPILRKKFWDYFKTLREQGRTLFITTQYVGEAAYCDFVGVMRQGRLIALDTPTNLRRIAMGGDVVQIVIDPVHERQAVQLLNALDAVTDVRRARGAPGQLYVYTQDSATALPLLATTLNGKSGIEVRSMEPYVPPFDDVFVRLMEQDDNA